MQHSIVGKIFMMALIMGSMVTLGACREEHPEKKAQRQHEMALQAERVQKARMEAQRSEIERDTARIRASEQEKQRQHEKTKLKLAHENNIKIENMRDERMAKVISVLSDKGSEILLVIILAGAAMTVFIVGGKLVGVHMSERWRDRRQAQADEERRELLRLEHAHKTEQLDRKLAAEAKMRRDTLKAQLILMQTKIKGLEGIDPTDLPESVAPNYFHVIGGPSSPPDQNGDADTDQHQH